MSYAKQLGKQYNAGTAWTSLGTDRSSYDQSSQPIYTNIFERIRTQIPKPSLYPGDEGDIKNYVDSLAQGTLFDIRSKGSKINMDNFGGLFNTFASLPDVLYSQALSGKYMDLF